MCPDYRDENRDIWRGRTSQRISGVEEQVTKLWAWIARHEEAAESAKKEIFSRISVLETKLWAMCGLAGFGGTILALLVAAAFKRFGV